MPVEPPESLRLIASRVGARLDGLLVAEQERWAAVDPLLAEPIEALRRIAGGGKRVRPAFCHWGWVAAGGDPDDARIDDAGAAVELLHTMAIVHDDIMDDSARRHGGPALHADFAARHGARAWHGESRRFGDGAAILVGDLAFVYADRLLRGAPATAWEVFDDLRLEVNIGQYLDLVATATGAATPELARTICVLKAAKYTVERPLHLGAALGGRFDELAKPFSAYGLPLGEAFQLRDDLLGAFGDGTRLGKDVGDDLRDGKPTALFAVARSRAGGDGAALLRDRYGRADLTGDEIEAILRVFVETGARAEVERTVATLADEALAALPEIPAPARDELEALARFAVGRDF
jgi:geranylgeranyl diphosphate synthase type I